ncbi:hypothetical protein [Myroides odoratimimus]|uniref:hypothetical protein n=1 Tax=Myroides odoratimimus TaxID=76832 RepID=UPI0004683EC2|nr:hypothetical protein [Myroides odoratimimus]
MPEYKFTYNEQIKLPPINSFFVDFLGYYNNSPDIRSLKDLNVSKKPTFYYYPNSFEKSLLPFEAGNKTHYKIEGYFDRTANDFSKAWILNKIEYPQGGWSSFEYELNTFTIFEKEVKGGGLRLSKQILHDGKNITDERTYQYLNKEGKTSGSIYALPFLGHPTRKFFHVNHYTTQNGDEEWSAETDKVGNDMLKYFRVFNKSNLTTDITIGAYVGYSKVIEQSQQLGTTESTFTSNEINPNTIFRTERHLREQTSLALYDNFYCIAEFLIMNSGIGSDIYTDHSNKRGKLLEKKVFDNNKNLLQQVSNSYINLSNQYKHFTQPVNQPSARGESFGPLHHLLTATKDYHINNHIINKQTITHFYNNLSFPITKEFQYNTSGIMTNYKELNRSTTYKYVNEENSFAIDEEFIEGYEKLKYNTILALL